jgi:hypothetical protein
MSALSPTIHADQTTRSYIFFRPAFDVVMPNLHISFDIFNFGFVCSNIKARVLLDAQPPVGTRWSCSPGLL